MMRICIQFYKISVTCFRLNFLFLNCPIKNLYGNRDNILFIMNNTVNLLYNYKNHRSNILCLGNPNHNCDDIIYRMNDSIGVVNNMRIFVKSI